MSVKVDEFKKHIGVAFDEENSDHVAVLKQYWNLCFEPLPFERRSKKWSDIGFQGMDPATDFRGAGICGLRHLCYFRLHFPEEFSLALKSGYPVSIAGLNISMLIYQLLGYGFKKVEIDARKKKMLYDYLFEGEDFLGNNRLENLYCKIFLMLDKQWREQNATYMMFPIVMQNVREKLIANMEQIIQSLREEDEKRSKKDLIEF